MRFESDRFHAIRQFGGLRGIPKHFPRTSADGHALRLGADCCESRIDHSPNCAAETLPGAAGLRRGFTARNRNILACRRSRHCQPVFISHLVERLSEVLRLDKMPASGRVVPQRKNKRPTRRGIVRLISRQMPRKAQHA